VVQRYAATFQEFNQLAVPERRGVFEEYRYDPLGRRVMVYSRRPNPGLCNNTTLCVSSTDLFVWNGDQLHGERYRGSWRSYVHGLGIDRPLKIGEILPHADFRGQYELGSYASGADFTAADYPADHRGAFLNEPVTRLPNGYASLLQDQMDGSGLMYRRNRYYDPASGRFTQEDPIGLAGGLNLYGYANGDPVNYSDPFGLCPGLTPTLSIFDCPPYYFTVIGTLLGLIGGGVGGAGAGLVVAAPTGELAAPVLVPALSVAGAAKGAAAGFAIGATLDGIVQMADAGKGRGGNQKPNRDVRRIAKENGLNEEGRRALHDEITGQDLLLDEIRAIAKELALQPKYLKNPPSPPPPTP
jgi:RHS repeat-associated protein